MGGQAAMAALLGSSNLLGRTNDHGLRRHEDSWVRDGHHRVSVVALYLQPLLALLLCGLKLEDSLLDGLKVILQ